LITGEKTFPAMLKRQAIVKGGQEPSMPQVHHDWETLTGHGIAGGSKL
jgi:hypothetical protein